MKKILSLILTIALVSIAFAAVPMDKKSMMKIAKMKNDVNKTSKTPYSGIVSDSFDKSINGYGWYLSHNRKI